MVKGLLPLSFVAGVLGALALAVPASAATYNGVCGISGTAHTDPDVQTVGGSGGYTISASVTGGTNLHLTCAGRDVANASVNEVVDVNATSTGTYVNMVCGTGRAHPGGTALAGPITQTAGTSTAPGTAIGTALPGATYDILFVGEQGDFGWGPTSTIKGSAPDPGTPGDTFGGYITISASFDPDDGNDPPPVGCTDHFTVSGSIIGNYSG
jgi:hypothetical protein